MNIAGPVEFSAADIIGALVVVALVYVILPAGAGIFAVRRYRATRPSEQQTSGGVAIAFVVGAVAASVLIGVLAWLGEQVIS